MKVGRVHFQGVAAIGASPIQYFASCAIEMTSNILEAMGADVIKRKLTVSNASHRVGSDREIVDEMSARSISMSCVV